MILRVGLTGGLASGKSTVAARLREHGVPTLDADDVVRDLYRSGARGTRAVEETLGKEFLDVSGGVDRAKVASLVFSDPAALARLDAVIHPLVVEAVMEWSRDLEAREEPIAVVEATLLVEAGARRSYDFLVAVSAPADQRVSRAAAHLGGPEEARRRMAAQISDAEREKAADIVIVNDGTREELLEKADVLAARLLEEAAKRSELSP